MVTKRSCPLYSLAIVWAVSCWALNSSDFLETNINKWLLISPLKIFWAVSWLNSTTNGKALAATNLPMASTLTRSSVMSFRPSSNFLNKTMASPSTLFSVAMSDPAAASPNLWSSLAPATSWKIKTKYVQWMWFFVYKLIKKWAFQSTGVENGQWT